MSTMPEQIAEIPVGTEDTLRNRAVNALIGGACIFNIYSAIRLIPSEFPNGLPDALREPDKAGLLVLGAVVSALYLRVVMHNVGRQIAG